MGPSERERRTLPLARDSRVVEQPAFRDPPSPVPALKLRLARLIARAERLPIEIPRTFLTLLDVEVDRRGVELVFGAPDELARILLARPPNAPRVTATLTTRPVPGLERHRPYLEAAAERLAASTTNERWSEALTIVAELTRAPAAVPMTYLRQLVEGVDPAPGLVRVGFQCNQDCGMCWQGRDWGRYDAAAILTWIEDLARAGAKHLMISGGEPTADRRIVDYVAHARTLGFERITLETNAILMTRDGLAARLRDAGLDSAFVSLHSGDAATSDAITRAPGTHARTIAGIHALLGAGVQVLLNAVATREGLARLPELPAFVAREFGAHPRLRDLMLSYPTNPFDRALMASIIPEPESLRVALRETIRRAAEHGVRIAGLDGPCGPALCAFDADPCVASLAPKTSAAPFRGFPAACDGCAVRDACLGVQDIAVEMFGDDAVRPLERVPQRS